MTRIVDRFQILRRTRRPFVATADYVGPSRRDRARMSELGADDVSIPNSLYCKSVEGLGAGALQRMIDMAWDLVHRRQALSEIQTVGRLMARVAAFYNGEGTPQDHRRDIARLTECCSKLARHQPDTFAFLGEVAEGIAALTAKLAKDLDLSAPMAAVLFAQLRDAFNRTTAELGIAA